MGYQVPLDDQNCPVFFAQGVPRNVRPPRFLKALQRKVTDTQRSQLEDPVESVEILDIL